VTSPRLSPYWPIRISCSSFFPLVYRSKAYRSKACGSKACRSKTDLLDNLWAATAI
jgi:hypothetical protein